MPVCLSPNGMTTYRSDTAATDLFVATAEGIEVLKRDGLSAPWRNAERRLDGVHVSSLCVEPVRRGIFAGGHYEGGLWRSLDNGASWQEITNGLTTRHVYTVTSAREDGRPVLYCGTEPARLFRSDDYGDSWTELPALRTVPGHEKWSFPAPPHVGHLKHIGIDPVNPRRIIACIEQGGLYVSEDAGQSWTSVTNWIRPNTEAMVYNDCHRVLFEPSNPNGLYLIGGDGIHYTPDRMQSWEHFDTRSLGVAYPDHIVVDRHDDRRMWIAGTVSNPNVWRTSKDANSRAMRSTDGGRTWELTPNGWPAHMRAAVEAQSLHASPEAISLFAGNTDGEVWSSDDAGATWRLISGNLPPISKVGHYRNLQLATA